MRLKILLLSHKFYPDVGGIETLSEFLAFSFFNAGHEVHLATWSLNEKKDSFPFKIIRKPTIQMLLLEHSWADLVFENNPCLRLAWPSIFYRRPFIVGIHTWISRPDGSIAWQDKIKLKWLKRANSVIACSDAIRKRSWPKASVIGNAFQNDVFRIIPDIPRTIEFAFLGRLVSDKGADLAIRAFHRLFLELNAPSTNLSKPILTIIGDGAERENLLTMVSELGLEKNIIFKGTLRGEALVECLNQHKFLLIPSVWEEPFGIVALEGMACGCIPIVSDSGGLPEAVGKAGLFFERGNVDSLVTSMKEILNDQTLKENLLQAAPTHLKAFHSDIVGRKYLKLVESTLKN